MRLSLRVSWWTTKTTLGRELDEVGLAAIVGGGSALGAAGQACGYLRRGAAVCDSLGLGDSQRPASAKRKVRPRRKKK